MRDGHDGAGVAGEVLLEPQHALGVEVVGGLVEQQQVGLAQQQLAQRDAADLATGQVGDRRVTRRAAERVHRLLDLRVDLPGVDRVQVLLEDAHLLHELIGVVGRHLLGDLVVPPQLDHGLAEAVLDVLLDGLVRVELGLLQEDPDRGLGVEECLAVGRLVQAGHDLEDRGLTGAVGADHADLRTGVEGHRDVVEDHLVPVRLTNLLHGVYELGHSTLSPAQIGHITAAGRGHDPHVTCPPAAPASPADAAPSPGASTRRRPPRTRRRRPVPPPPRRGRATRSPSRPRPPRTGRADPARRRRSPPPRARPAWPGAR